jgi:hypothetical protein
MLISWPANANGWVLQQSLDLSAPNWADVTNNIVIVGNQKQFAISSPSVKGFFRLMHP